jgi:hypothetical protein
MIGQITGRILDHPDTQLANVQGAPQGMTRFARMSRGGDLAPVRDGEGQRWNFHSARSHWHGAKANGVAVMAPPAMV